MSTISVGFYFVSNQLRLPWCVNHLSWILFCIKPAQTDCGPLEEGVSTTLTCGISCGPGGTLYWYPVIYKNARIVARCQDDHCEVLPIYSNYFTINPTGSTLTINSVSRSDPLNMETWWRCACSGVDTVCGRLQVYGQFLFSPPYLVCRRIY